MTSGLVRSPLAFLTSGLVRFPLLPPRGGREVDPFTKQEIQKKMMLERFQEENPGCARLLNRAIRHSAHFRPLRVVCSGAIFLPLDVAWCRRFDFSGADFNGMVDRYS